MDYMRDKPIVMGILNVTPDSFSDGGKFNSIDRAVLRAIEMVKDGAEIIDVGGESTRPFSEPVSVSEEIERICPVISVLKRELPEDVVISVDTRNTDTMKEAVACGVSLINDINALQSSGALNFAAKCGADVCLMHMQKSPYNMQKEPFYHDVVKEVHDFLIQRAEACVQAGIDKSKIILDPGVGFGKTQEHNLALIKHINCLSSSGYPVLLGASRKSFIEQICADGEDTKIPPTERMAGSISAALWCLSHGTRIFRVHDVKETRQALDVYDALLKAI